MESRERVREMREALDNTHFKRLAAERAAEILANFVADEMTHGNLQAAQRMARLYQNRQKSPASATEYFDPGGGYA